MKLPHGDLNPNSYPQHPTSIYTYRITTAPRVCGGYINNKVVDDGIE